jgi:hypothetical protein
MEHEPEPARCILVTSVPFLIVDGDTAAFGGVLSAKLEWIHRAELRGPRFRV